MAKETMQAISDAELKARDTVLHAKEEGERIAAEAEAAGAEALKAAVKEARKKADVLCGVARADAEKTRTAVREQTLSQQKELRQSAGANSARVAEEIRKIVLGKA